MAGIETIDVLFKKSHLTIRGVEYTFFLVMGDDDIVYYNKSDVLFLNKTLYIKDDLGGPLDGPPIISPPTQIVISLLPREIFRQIVEVKDLAALAPFLTSNSEEERKLASTVANLLSANLASSEASV